MRVVVVGASGNVGTSVLTALESEPSVTSIVGVARRMPDWCPAKTEWRTADVFRDDLGPIMTGADAVVHLAWLFQPTHDPVTTWNANVIGSMRVFAAAARAGVSVLVHSSSVGAYSPGPKDPPVDESWPTHGWPNAAYAREKAYVERVLDVFERDHPDIRVVRMRPGFIFKEEAATEQRRLFAGPFLPQRLVRPGTIPFVPDMPRLRFQALHSLDAGEAFRLALTRDVRGAFNLAADPVVDPAVLADLLGARRVPVPATLVRTAVAAGWHLRLIPASPGLVEMALQIPIMDITRAREELGWRPRHTAVDALRAVLEGMRRGAGMGTPPLAPDSGRGRIKEVTTGVGIRP
ncbi:NAD-dependent epimerase/dehydratase family protein [Microbispora triticiradicis]|uniref:NAD-dependent epimerase/dehydratase family protein n=3 Tax=Microbispora TaxID=2005 RepID=A0ABY3M4V0_9ACTN|nr:MULTISPECIES: NAD-dependent epimerase/dehydratase family protein [Microbispora]RGA06566.1 NAD-dependent epimerase/dehydratase family protein [Microbispora triticiradicis]TLP66794.1 NAD-dependent epimerase/dehydratase family protein [Microbispora fusca]TYB67390.1 NAD-dependent epimerase/dehydratase family protein [Microbispora tritici]GLW25731.1 NAD-dependent epimerase [Microbispora amethystogenes]